MTGTLMKVQPLDGDAAVAARSAHAKALEPISAQRVDVDLLARRLDELQSEDETTGASIFSITLPPD